MNIVKYFGITEEITGKTSEHLDLIEKDVSEVVNLIEVKYPKLRETQFKIAINESIVEQNQVIGRDDVVAILPPFGGG